jgi:formylglycine-generating enzyme required for sulfatase activity
VRGRELVTAVLGGSLGITVAVAQDPPAAEPAGDVGVEGMVLVPAGTFLLGSTKADASAESDEMPQRVVDLPAFYIDQFEVSNIEYKRFVDATGYRPPPHWKDGTYEEGADWYPVMEVSFWEATAYARWAKKRLPTEAEWEKAARGTDGRRYPWGDDFQEDKSNVTRAYAPINAHLGGASPYGAVNMSGNVAEWTSSVYEPYPELVPVLPSDFGGVDSTHVASRPKLEPVPAKLPPRGAKKPPPAGADSTANIRDDDPRLQFFSVAELSDTRPRVYRGGSVNGYASFARCANREHAAPGARWYNIGFRCAKDAPPQRAKQH